MPDETIEVRPDEQTTTAVAETPAVVAVPDKPQGPDRNEVALKILDDPELPPEDYDKARSDPEYMAALVDAYIEEEQKTPSEAAPKKEEAKTAGESETPKEEQEREETKRKPRRGFQRKIDRLTERNSSLEAELEQERQRRATLEGRLVAGRPQAARSDESSAAELAGTTLKPKRDDFTDYDDFVEALSDWKAGQKATETTHRILESERQRNEAWARQNALRQMEGQRTGLWQQTSEAARKTHDDFDDVIEEADLPPFSDAVGDAILLTGIGGEVSYWLASNPEEANRILNLPTDISKILEIGNVAVSLKKSNGSPSALGTKKADVSRASPPIRQAGGLNSKTVKNYEYYSSDQCSPAEYEEARRTGKLR